jgi:hypothetical protein
MEVDAGFAASDTVCSSGSGKSIKVKELKCKRLLGWPPVGRIPPFAKYYISDAGYLPLELEVPP